MVLGISPSLSGQRQEIGLGRVIEDATLGVNSPAELDYHDITVTP